MCGIVGGISKNNIVPVLLQGLQRMEYRGYDSAGLAIIQGKELVRVRKVGRVATLVDAVQQLSHPKALAGHIGIAHTRWATHGKPSEANAHPHLAGNRVLVVHNGIIENFQSLKEELIEQGAIFESDTDSEVIAQLLLQALQQPGDGDSGAPLLRAVSRVIKRMAGSYAFVAMDAEDPTTLVAAALGAPLVVGRGAASCLVASDPVALAAEATEAVYLEPGELAMIGVNEVQFFDSKTLSVKQHAWQTLNIELDNLALGAYRHFMLKEIYEQPIIAKTWLATLFSGGDGGVAAASLINSPVAKIWPKVQRVKLVACGTSFYAALLGKLWLEKWVQLPSQVEVASEFRYNSQVVEAGTLVVVISQSGETADTLAAMRLAKQSGYLATLAISNVKESTLMREADLTLLTKAGVEIGVASTKALTAQLIALVLLSLSFNRAPSLLSHTLMQELAALPSNLNAVIQLEPAITCIAKQLYNAPHLFFLGRTTSYPIALEGALKMKELSYLHAEGYAAGELKHGPLALIDTNAVVVALVPSDAVASKMMDNLHEVEARGGKVIALTGLSTDMPSTWTVLKLPLLNELAPLSFLPALQLLAYHVALLRGCDVDKPRNLAKSVTVE